VRSSALFPSREPGPLRCFSSGGRLTLRVGALPRQFDAMTAAGRFAIGATAIWVSLTQLCSAQTWSTGFFNSADGYGPTFFSLDGAPTNAPSGEQWQTTDPYNPITDLGSTSQLQYLNGWTFGLSASGNQSVLFGGYSADGGVLPGVNNPVLYRQFDHTFGTATTTFSVDFGIIGPSSTLSLSYTNRDVFGFNLAATNGTSLAAFQLTAAGATPGFLQVNWLQNGTNVVTNGTTFSGTQIQYGALYRLTATLSSNTVSMELAGLTAENGGPGVGITNYAAGTPSMVVNGGEISAGLTSSDFEVAALTWDLASGDNLEPGANYMIVNTVSVVPEPSTVALVGVALVALGYGCLRRRVSRG